MVDTLHSLTDDEFLTAGQLTLGVLEGDELSHARRLQLSSAAFAEAVKWWEMKLGAMAEAAGELPLSADLLPAIHAQIDRLQLSGTAAASLESKPGKPAPWSIGFALTGLVSAAAALVLFLQTPSTTGPAGPDGSAPSKAAASQLVAQLSDDENGRRIAGIIDPDKRTLTVTATGLNAGAGRTAELWVIASDGVPRSLGYLPAEGAISRELTAFEAGLLVEGSALAVTFEDDTGVPHEEPTLPILLVGPLDRV